MTLAGRLMRGRHTMAILKMMGVTETIAETVDGYIAIAVRLAADADWRRQVNGRFAANRHTVYRDRACIDALEAFLIEATRSTSA